MKKNLILFSSVLLLILTACGNNTNSENNEITAENNTSQTEQESNAKDSNNGNQSKNKDENSNNLNEKEDNEAKNSQDEQEENTEEIEPEYEVNSDTWSIDPIDDANENIVLVTIDDAPDKHALEMAETLKDLEVNAIFFVNGHFLETDEKKEILKKIYDMGFVIGNHTYSHPNLSNISPEEQREEISKVSDMVEEITGERPTFFRAPHGVNTDTSRKVVEEENMILMNWTYGYDYFKPYEDKDKLTEAMISGKGPEVDVDYSLLKPGANLLMHDRDWTNAALYDIVTGLQDKGYDMIDPLLIKTK